MPVRIYFYRNLISSEKTQAYDILTHVVEESSGVEPHTQYQQQVHSGENAA